MAARKLNPKAFQYHFEDLLRRTREVFQSEGPGVVIWKTLRKIFSWIWPRPAASGSGVYEIATILRDPMFDYASLNVEAAIQPEPVVSIVIPVFNGLSFVPDCVSSFFQAPSGLQFEVIAIDNGSKDGTLEALHSLSQEYPNLKVIANQINRGFAGAINQGGAWLARGEFLAICNSDIIVTPGWLDRLVQAMRSDASLAVISPVTNYVGEGPQLDLEAAHVTPDTAAEYAQQVAGRSGLIYAARSAGVLLCLNPQGAL